MRQRNDLKRALSVAIVGSVDPEREDYNPSLEHADQARQAAEDIGRALAEAGLRIVVYSGESNFLEALVVQGYVASGKAERESIEVWHRVNHAAARFAEQRDHGELFKLQPDNSSSWEGSFYRSLGKVDGLLLIGGGRSTMIAGHVALGFQLPVLAIATFGGKAREIWGALDGAELGANRAATDVMAPTQWTGSSAKACVETLIGIIKAKHDQAAELLALEAAKTQSIARTARFAIGLLVATLLMLPLGWLMLGLPSVWFLGLVFLAPILAGACGSTLSTLRPAAAQHSAPQQGTPLSATVALGAAAGALSALLYMVAQLAANPKLFADAEVPFLILPYAVLIAVGGGLAFERVYARLEKLDPLKPVSETAPANQR